MQVLFGPYGSVLPSLGISSDVLKIVQRGQQDWYRLAVEMIARGYVDAGATLPTINAFYLRLVLHKGFPDLFKEMLSLNLRATLTAMAYQEPRRIALCLGPVNDCYMPELAPSAEDSYIFHKRQYELCLDVLGRFGLSLQDVIFLHETIGTQREAIGLSRAAKALGIVPLISFIVLQDGRLLSGELVEHTIQAIDTNGTNVEGFSLNCCSPYALEKVYETFNNKSLFKRIIGFYPNSYDADPRCYESGACLYEPSKKEILSQIIQNGKQHSLQLIGGCCGFGYHDLKQLVELLNK